MLKNLWIRAFYRLFFTVWLSVLTATGAESGFAFFSAVAVGCIIDLLRYKYVSHVLLGDSDSDNKGNIFHRAFSYRDNSTFVATIVIVSYIWVICILDMFVPHPIMDFYYSLFEPLYFIISSLVAFVRNHPQELIEHGFENRVLITQHVYTIGIVGWVVGLLSYSFFAHKVIAPWKADNDTNTPDPLTLVPNITLLLFAMIAFWVGWNFSHDIEFIPKPEDRFHYRIHDNNLGFMFSYSMIIVLLNAITNVTFQILTSARNRLDP